MKSLLSILAIPLLLSACAIHYEPSQNVLTIQENLSRQEALKIFSGRLKYGRHIDMCGYAGGFAFDKTANPSLNDNTIHMTAFKLGDYVKGDRSVRFYKKEYYAKAIDISKISRIDLYNKHTYPIIRDSCFDSDDYRGSRMNANDIALVYWIGTLERFTIRIPENEADKYLAATRVIFPSAKITLAKK